VRETLQRTGLDPSRLHLELTEAIMADVPPQIIEQLHRLRALGVQIGLDDFGTGYVSLLHLRRLPLTYLKIDRRLVRGTGSDPGTEQVLAAVIGLAADLGLRSIAEGVGTPAQLDRLRVLRCVEAQGDLLALPMPVASLPSATDVKLRSLIKRIS
jgi:EAL domain-containing protein (putative c-di-GMP-specific phosphodiesterase class I)